jgi:hypothetical protein
MKKLLLLGNGAIPHDISEQVSSFDYVFRINRMTNIENTGDKIDGLFLTFSDDFIKRSDDDKLKEYFAKAKQIFINFETKLKLLYGKKWEKFISKEQWLNANIMSFSENKKHIGCNYVTTTIRVLDVITTEPQWCDNYEIWIAGITVDGRAEMMKNGEEWDKKPYRQYGEYEERFLKRLIDEGKIKLLFPEEYSNGIKSEI